MLAPLEQPAGRGLIPADEEAAAFTERTNMLGGERTLERQAAGQRKPQ